MNILKKVINIVLAFVITIAILLNFLVIIMANTVLEESYITSKLQENGYYEKIDTDLKNGFATYQYQSGFSEEIFKDLYSYTVLENDIKSIISSVYNGTEVALSTDKVYEKLSANIDTYLAENNITAKDAVQENINEFKDVVIKTYEEKMNSISKYIDNIHNVMSKIKAIEKFVIIGLLVALLFAIILDLLVNITHLPEFMETIGISLLSSGVLLIFIKFIISKSIDINNILIISQSLSDFMKYVCFDILNKFKLYGLIFMAIGIIVIISANYKKANEIS